MSNIRSNYIMLSNGKVHRFPIGGTPTIKSDKISKDSVVMLACTSMHLGEYWVRMSYKGYKNWHKLKKFGEIKFEYTFVHDYEQWEEYNNIEEFKESFTRPNIESFINDIILFNAKVIVFNSMLWAPGIEYTSYFSKCRVILKDKSGKVKKVELRNFLHEYLGYTKDQSNMYVIPYEEMEFSNYRVGEENWKLFNKKIKKNFNLIQIPDTRLPVYISATKAIKKIDAIKIKHRLYLMDNDDAIIEDYDSSERGDLVFSKRAVKIKSIQDSNFLDYFYFKMYRYAFHELGIMTGSHVLQLRSQLKVVGKIKKIPAHIPDPYASRAYPYKVDSKNRVILQRKVKPDPKPEPIKLVWKDKPK